MKNLIMSWGLIFLSALFDSLAAFIVKRRFNEFGTIDFSSIGGFFHYMYVFIKAPIMLLAITIFFAAPALWFVALNKIALSVGYPALVAFHLLFVFILGVWFLDEPLTPRKLAAVVMLLASVCLLFSK